MKRISALLAIAVAAVAFTGGDAAAQAKKWSKVRIATEGAYMPWNGKDASGKLVGFEIDLANEFCKRKKVQCEVVAQDWDGILPALVAKKYDVIMAGMNITPKRMETINFTRPYASGPHGFAVMKSSPLAKIGKGPTLSLTANKVDAQKAIDALKVHLKGKVIGAQVSTTNSAFVEEHFKGVASDIRLYKTTEQHDLDLAAGRIDAAFAANSYWTDVLSKPAGKDMMTVGPALSGGALGLGVAVGVRKGDDDLKKMFDDTIAAAIKDGTIKTMSMKWFKLDMTPKS
jgi:octopine/nopaline transport system substrate-binding protein